MTQAASITEPSTAVQHALGVLGQAKAAVTAYDRADLGDRLAAARARLDDPAFHVLVVGEFKQGKSSLINALLDAALCPVDDDIATSAPTIVRFAQEPSAAVLFRAQGDEPDAELPRQEIPVDRVRDFVTEAANPADQQRVHSVEIGVPSELLADGLVLVDTPGVGGLGSAHGAITIGALPMADALIFVSDGSQEYSAPELDFLRMARSMCPNVVCVLTKTDFYPEWRTIKELDQAHLRKAGVDATMLAVSSTLRLQALELGDRELDAESGFGELVEYLQRDIVGNAERLSVKAACNDVLAVVDQLIAQFQAEKAALDKPEEAGELMGRLEAAKERAERLRSQAAKWQQTLADGIADLSNDVDFDLRARVRRIMQESDEAIEETDPADTWDEFEPWLYRRVGEDVANNYRYLQQRTRELSERVAEHFALDHGEVALDFNLGSPGGIVERVEVEAGLDVELMGTGQQLWTGVRGGYVGVLMLSALGGMAGLALGPLLPVAAGLILGRKSLRDEKDRQLALRRTQAKNSMRKYVDEVQFVVGKDSRDALRRIQRQLRDHYTARADELQRSLADGLRAAQHAVQSDQATRQRRQRDVEAELRRIQTLRKSALEVARDRLPAAAGTA
jgi:Dynamin family